MTRCVDWIMTFPPDLCSEPSISSLTQLVCEVKTVQKIKHFIWQALSNCVPVCNRLADRHSHPSRTCPRCGLEEETINHLLFECPLASQTWSLVQLPLCLGEFPSTSIYSNFDLILNCLHKRNGSGEDAEDWRQAQIIPEAMEENATINIPAIVDVPSRRPFFMFDASWKDDNAQYGGGLVIENEDGSTMFGSYASNRVLSPLHAEFCTLLWAMKSSLILGHDSMAFESDCLQLVKLIEEEEEWPITNQNLINSINFF
ncbi:hypothetical protein Bca52824_010186 [Brassica carinata]|uniref:Reverse transcriptase zinc-binding domain-containing protein n=1 Tax=Brassica carinata TaxID=52824 RepID=A0A8X8BAL9_BRACI|nr:hypothetical protein Bca52824_010186 [Brassica carinata]